MRLIEADVSIALVGNPNTGKTTLFNALTGLSHRVGNYPGVTVERVAGVIDFDSFRAQLVDLPGTYSLAARSLDEMIAVDVLLGQQRGAPPTTAILAILDANNFKRNCYLLSQLAELDLPLVVALNMTDVARRHGIEIDTRALSDELGVPVVATAADRGEGLRELRAALEKACAGDGPRPRARAPLPEALAAAGDTLHAWLNQHSEELGRVVPRAEACRALIDIDGEFEKRLRHALGDAFGERLAAARASIGGERSPHAAEAVARYAWIDGLAERCVRRPKMLARTKTDRIDAVLTHKLWGSVALVTILGGVFQAIYAWSAPLMDAIDGLFGWIGSLVNASIPAGPLQSLIVDGVIGGAGGVIVFLPQILILVFFIALLEDCGYMARAAFLADRLLARLGLTGRSVIPLLSSFACAVPGIMAARTIEARRNRLATILVAPLMSCSARLPVYVLLIGAFVPQVHFFGGWLGLQGLVLLLAHAVGVVIAVPVLLVFRRTILRGARPPFVMELPPYRLPVWRNVSARLLDQSRAFLVRAGTIIFAVAVVIWALSYFPRPESIHERFETQRAAATSAAEINALDNEEAAAYLEQSILGRFGKAIEPAVEPLGWDWRIGMAVTGSFAAREIVIATMGTIFSVGNEVDEASASLVDVLRDARWPDGRPLFDLAVALSLIVFFALCCQCVATLAVIRRETGSWGWAAFTFGYMTALAYVGALVVYQVSSAAGA